MKCSWGAGRRELEGAQQFFSFSQFNHQVASQLLSSVFSSGAAIVCKFVDSLCL